jgi:hypothetical protein
VRRALGLALGSLTLLLAGCPASFIDPCDDNACVAPDGGVVPAGCDPTKDLAASPACVDELLGWFVSPSGSDATGDGTRAKPFATLGKALSQTGKKRIYVCEGTYEGAALVTRPIAIYGGLRCDWKPGGGRPVVRGDTPEIAMRITAAGTTVTDLVIQAKDATQPSQSSIALTVAAGGSARLERVRVVAGAAQPGSDGAVGAYGFPAPSALDGKPGSGTSGGAANAFTCPGGAVTTGGKGGDNGLDGQAGQPAGAGGAAGTFAACASNQGGGAGSDGASATDATAPAKLGTIGASWSPTPGARGGDGAPGQGGGGGGGRGGGGGGGGGAGGCGGAGGGGGGGGGASIAILAVDAAVTLVASELVTGAAGKGGNGAAGQTGQATSGAAGAPATGGCSGGAGGKGGAGGAGAGGAGGVAIGVLYKGTAPVLDAATTGAITLGAKGAAGTGGAPGKNDGLDGLAKATLAVE